MTKAVHLSAIRSRTSRDGHCGSITEGGDADLGMSVHLSNSAGKASNIPNGMYGWMHL